MLALSHAADGPPTAFLHSNRRRGPAPFTRLSFVRASAWSLAELLLFCSCFAGDTMEKLLVSIKVPALPLLDKKTVWNLVQLALFGFRSLHLHSGMELRCSC